MGVEISMAFPVHSDINVSKDMKGTLPLQGKIIAISDKSDSDGLQSQYASAVQDLFKNSNHQCKVPVQDLTNRYGYGLPQQRLLARRQPQSQSELSSRQVESILRGPKLKQSRPLRRHKS